MQYLRFSPGLFHQAILQSGSDTAPWALNLPSMSPKRFTIDTAKALKCTTETSEKMVECLRGIDVDTLLENEQTYLPVSSRKKYIKHNFLSIYRDTKMHFS